MGAGRCYEDQVGAKPPFPSEPRWFSTVAGDYELVDPTAVSCLDENEGEGTVAWFLAEDDLMGALSVGGSSDVS